MSRRDAIVLASRLLAVLLSVWALTEVSYLPAAAFFVSPLCRRRDAVVSAVLAPSLSAHARVHNREDRGLFADVDVAVPLWP